MADIDIDPFGDHKSRPEEPTGENIPLTPGGGSTWEPELEQVTSFGGESKKTELTKERVMGCIKSYLKVRVKPQKHFISIILNSEKENCTTKARACP